MLRQDDQAIDWMSRTIAAAPDWPCSRIACCKSCIERASVGSPRGDGTLLALGGAETVAQWKMDSPADAATYLAYRERFYEGLRKAGMREEWGGGAPATSSPSRRLDGRSSGSVGLNERPYRVGRRPVYFR